METQELISSSLVALWFFPPLELHLSSLPTSAVVPWYYLGATTPSYRHRKDFVGFGDLST